MLTLLPIRSQVRTTSHTLIVHNAKYREMLIFECLSASHPAVTIYTAFFSNWQNEVMLIISMTLTLDFSNKVRQR